MYHCIRRLRVTFTWIRLQKQQPFCSKPPQPHDGLSSYDESLKKLDKMDFVTAAKMLFTDPPPKKRKFGLDFLLVQLVFACMPSLAVYLVAQYARYEMRKMEAEHEQKRKKQEEKAEEIELNATKEKEARSVPELLEVRERLEKLEETVKEIAAETKKQTVHSQAKGHEGDSSKKSNSTEASSPSSSESSKLVEKDPVKQDSIEPRPAAGSAKVPNAPAEGKIQGGQTCQDAKGLWSQNESEFTNHVPQTKFMMEKLEFSITQTLDHQGVSSMPNVDDTVLKTEIEDTN